MKLLQTIFILLIAATVCCCGSRGNRPRNSCWEPIDPEFDSLNLKIDYGLYEKEVNRDSIRVLLDQMRRHVNRGAETERRAKQSRWLMHSAWLEMNDRPEYAKGLLEKARSILDSTEYPYDLHRINDLRFTIDEFQGISHLSFFLSEIDYYRGIKDTVREANALQMAALRLGDVLPEKAIPMIKQSGDLMRQAGYEQAFRGNYVNLASILNECGKTKEAVDILKGLKENLQKIPDKTRLDNQAYNKVILNQYIYSGDTASLFEGRDRSRTDLMSASDAAIIEALMSEYYSSKPVPLNDSAIYYARKAYGRLNEPITYYRKYFVCKTLGDIYLSEGKSDSAASCLMEADIYRDSATNASNPIEIMKIQTLRDFNEFEKAAEEKHRQTITLLVTIGVALLVGMIFLFMILRLRTQRHRVSNMKRRLEAEQINRKLMAVTLASQEKDNMFTALRNQIHELVEDHKIATGDASRLETSIRQVTAGASVTDSFIEIFEKVNPSFVENLRSRCPGLADSYVRIASMILIGFDNRQIASVMNIRTESVHQARWRLRSRLGLQSGDSLEEELQRISDGE